MAGFQTIEIVQGEVDIGCVHLTPELAVALSSMGFDPSRFNALRWPIGASRHAYGEFLIDATQLPTTGYDETIGLKLGDKGSEQEFEGLFMLPPIPLLISGRGTRLYALPIVDGRHRFGIEHDEDYNALRDDLVTFDDDTIDGETPYDHADIIGLLETRLGITLASPAAPSATEPMVDVFAKGRRAAVVLDEVLADCGRVFVANYDGTYTTKAISAVTPSGLMNPLVGDVQAGNAVFGSGGTGVVGDSLPGLVWRAAVAPATVRVVFPAYTVGTSLRPTTHTIEVTSTGIDAALQVGAGVVHVIQDHRPAVFVAGEAAPENLTDLETRADEVAEAYLQRYVCGAIDAILAGMMQPAPSALAAEVIFYCSSVSGFQTRVRSGLHDTIRGWVPGRDRVRRRGFGPGVFPVKLTQTGGSNGNATTAASWTYTVETALGDHELGTAVSPVTAPHQWKRPAAGMMTAATFGHASYNGDGELVIGWTNETPGPSACG